MYVAIVVLPLIGAIIAGVIALVGARNRHPGADPSPPHDDHAAPLVPEDRAHGAPIPESSHAEIDHAIWRRPSSPSPPPARRRRS